MRGTLFDASALAAIALKEEGWKELLDFLPSKTLDLAFIESYNVVWKHFKILRDISEKEEAVAIKALKELEGLTVQLQAKKYLERAYEIARAFKVTIYDSVYVAACEAEGLKLVTRDAKQAKAAKELGVEVLLL